MQGGHIQLCIHQCKPAHAARTRLRPVPLSVATAGRRSHQQQLPPTAHRRVPPMARRRLISMQVGREATTQTRRLPITISQGQWASRPPLLARRIRRSRRRPHQAWAFRAASPRAAILPQCRRRIQGLARQRIPLHQPSPAARPLFQGANPRQVSPAASRQRRNHKAAGRKWP